MTTSAHPGISEPASGRGNGTISVAEIAEEMGISEARVRDLLRDNIIPNIRPGTRFIVGRAAFYTWLSTCGMDRVTVH